MSKSPFRPPWRLLPVFSVPTQGVTTIQAYGGHNGVETACGQQPQDVIPQGTGHTRAVRLLSSDTAPTARLSQAQGQERLHDRDILLRFSQNREYLKTSAIGKVQVQSHPNPAPSESSV